MSEYCSKCGVYTRGGPCETAAEARRCGNAPQLYTDDLGMIDISNSDIARHLRHTANWRGLEESEQAVLGDAATILERIG